MSLGTWGGAYSPGGAYSAYSVDSGYSVGSAYSVDSAYSVGSACRCQRHDGARTNATTSRAKRAVASVAG